MEPPRLSQQFLALAERESLAPDLSRATRAMIAAGVPVALSLTGHLPVDLIYATLAGLNIAAVDVRGDYSLRCMLLLAMIAILGAAAALGGWAGGSLVAGLLGMALVALSAGLWRHLSSDYGPSLAIAAVLVYVVGLHGAGGPAVALHHAGSAAAGGLFGLLLQVAQWPFRPEHPMRRLASETWLALANLWQALAPRDGEAPAARERRCYEAEAALREALDRAAAGLELTAARRPVLTALLRELTQVAADQAAQAAAFHPVMEGYLRRPDAVRVAPAFAPALQALVNTARTVAVALVSRQPRHLHTLDLRARRLTNLLGVLRERVPARAGASDESARLGEIVDRLAAGLRAAETALRATMERRGDHQAFSLELFEMEAWKFRALGASVDLSLRIDPALIRYSLRSAVLTMAGVAAMVGLQLHHGYWLPFTMMIVLQPDFGTTRQKAAQRVAGTVAGSVLASLLLYLQLPLAATVAAIGATAFAFNYYLKRSYGVAVVFITIFVMLLTETGGRVDLSFVFERVGYTVAGGLAGLLAAFIFWPTWERDRFPAIQAAALRANARYLRLVVTQIQRGGGPFPELAGARRAAEKANSAVFSSLRRLSGDPKNRQDRIERAAAVANGNQRLTRYLSAAAAGLDASSPAEAASYLEDFGQRAPAALEALARAWESGRFEPGELSTLRRGLDQMQPVAADGRPRERLAGTLGQLGRASTELGAMLIS